MEMFCFSQGSLVNEGLLLGNIGKCVKAGSDVIKDNEHFGLWWKSLGLFQEL